MKRIVIALFIVALLCAPSAVFAHKPLLTVEDNEDGTIYVETGFSDGSSGAGHKLVLKNKATGDLLSEYTIPEEGYMEEIPIPNVPYTVTFDAGPGHVVVKDGPFSDAAAGAVEEPAPAAVEETPEAAAEKPGAEAPPQSASVQAAATAETAQAVQAAVAAPASMAAAQPISIPQPVMATAAMGPGVEMAMKMALTSQMITALGVLIVLGALMFLLGYLVGKDAGKARA